MTAPTRCAGDYSWGAGVAGGGPRRSIETMWKTGSGQRVGSTSARCLSSTSRALSRRSLRDATGALEHAAALAAARHLTPGRRYTTGRMKRVADDRAGVCNRVWPRLRPGPPRGCPIRVSSARLPGVSIPARSSCVRASPPPSNTTGRAVMHPVRPATNGQCTTAAMSTHEPRARSSPRDGQRAGPASAVAGVSPRGEPPVDGRGLTSEPRLPAVLLVMAAPCSTPGATPHGREAVACVLPFVAGATARSGE